MSDKSLPAMPEGCTCHHVYLRGNEVVGTNINETCPHHGIGTDYYGKQTVYWNARLRELRELKKKQAEE